MSLEPVRALHDGARFVLASHPYVERAHVTLRGARLRESMRREHIKAGCGE